MMEKVIWDEWWFWVSIYLVGYITAVIALSFQYSSLYKQKRKGSKIFIKIGSIIVSLLFVIPPLILPFITQPRFSISTPLVLAIGMPILILSGIIGALAFKDLTSKTAWTGESKELAIKGIYRIIRHPNYLANSLFPIGWAIIFNAVYALYLTPLWFISYVILTFPEDRMLLKSFGEKYKEYKKKVRWRMIPKLL